MPTDMLALEENWSGYRPVTGRPSNWQAQEAVVRELVENHNRLPLDVRAVRLREAMTTDSFPLMFGDILGRELQNAFKTVGTPLAPIFLKRQYKDFDPKRIFRTEGLTRRLPIVGEKGEYQAREQGEERVNINLDKYGSQVDFSWEAQLRDDLGAFTRFPQELADSAINTEAWLQTQTLIGATGPIAAAFVDVVDGQAALSVLPLTAANVATGLEAKSSYTSTGEPIQSGASFLVVPPALQFTGLDILASVDTNVRPTTVSQAGLQLIVDPWIPIIATTGTVGSTCWFLASDASDIGSAVFATLLGASGPELWQKKSDAIKVGGGEVGQFDGDFATDNIFYRVRHSIGTVALEPRGLWGSWGQADPT